MIPIRRKQQRQIPDDRKQALITAASNVLAESGPDDHIVSVIADRAGVTQGLIRLYFSTKDDLIAAGY